MPTATATATKAKTKTTPTAQTDVETEAETEVVVDTGLIKILEKWDKSREQANKSQDAADQQWIQLAKYVRDHEISKEQLLYALVKIRGMKESSAKVEAVRLLRFQTSDTASEMLDRKIDGDEDITVHDLRSASVKRGEKAEPTDPTAACEKRLVTIAKFAISEAEMTDVSEFTALARKAFKTANTKLEAAARRNNEDEGGDEEEAEEETEGEETE